MFQKTRIVPKGVPKMNMHQIFGQKQNKQYIHRSGAYLIAVRDNKVAVVRTPKGLFLPGGGMEPGETEEQTIQRECLEETGYRVHVQKYLCSAEAYIEHPEIGHFHPIQSYYLGEFLFREQDPTEQDHQLEWIEYEKLKGNLFPEMQNWALEMKSDALGK